MNFRPVICVFFVSALGLYACGGVEGEQPESSRVNASTMVNQLPLEDCAEHGCPNGCVQIDYGVDDNANGSLDAGEIDGSEYICHGANGADGTNGQDGADGVDGQAGADGADGQSCRPAERGPAQGGEAAVRVGAESN